MRAMLRSPALALVALLAPFAHAGGSVVWDHVYEDAQARAKTEKKPLFVAVNMDGEVANDRAAEKLYRDPRVVAVSGWTVNVVASRFEHVAGDKPCTRFDGVTCKEHRAVDGSVRSQVLRSDGEGYVIAPQHVFLAPDGGVILSVPYEVAAHELEWCFLTALNKVDPQHEKPIPPSARPPRRLVMGAVFDPSTIEGANLAPPSRERVLELIKELKAGLFGEGREEKLLRVMTSSEPEAVKYIAAELSIDLFGRRGLGAGTDPANPGRGDRQQRLMHAIGVLSPPVYAEIVVDYLDHSEVRLRQEAAVALEQLAAPESVRDIASALAKEKEPHVRKDLARALGSAGANDEKALKSLAKLIASDKDERVRVNALIALGWSSPNAEVDRELASRLGSAVLEERGAAVIAMALSQSTKWVALLETLTAIDAETKALCDTALAVLRGGSRGALREPLKKIAGDDIQRERLFGRAN
jgi:hypothetical protein